MTVFLRWINLVYCHHDCNRYHFGDWRIFRAKSPSSASSSCRKISPNIELSDIFIRMRNMREHEYGKWEKRLLAKLFPFHVKNAITQSATCSTPWQCSRAPVRSSPSSPFPRIWNKETINKFEIKMSGSLTGIDHRNWNVQFTKSKRARHWYEQFSITKQ